VHLGFRTDYYSYGTSVAVNSDMVQAMYQGPKYSTDHKLLPRSLYGKTDTEHMFAVL
jgi:hypothetical protein